MRAVCIGVMFYYQRRPLYSTGVLRVFPGAGRWSGLAGRVVPPVLSDPVKGRGPGHDRHCFMLFYIALTKSFSFCAAAPSLSFIGGVRGVDGTPWGVDKTPWWAFPGPHRDEVARFAAVVPSLYCAEATVR